MGIRKRAVQGVVMESSEMRRDDLNEFRSEKMLLSKRSLCDSRSMLSSGLVESWSKSITIPQ